MLFLLLKVMVVLRSLGDELRYQTHLLLTFALRPLTVTDQAVAKVRALLADEGNDALRLRVFVTGGGCAGFQYGFTFDEEVNEDDFDFEYSGVKVLVDSMSMQYLTGATIDYKEDLMGSTFAIDNPNAETSCGCGSSFSPY
jgi:iron-sulfur cluster insertion protein